MYPRPFHYHRASGLREAAQMLSELGEEARVIAGGQSLIPLMKFRFAVPQHLVDLNFVPEMAYLREDPGQVAVGALTRHAQIGEELNASDLQILKDCALGIADVQVRNRGTLAGSIAEADPSGDWAPALLTQDSELSVIGPQSERVLPFRELISDAYTTVLEEDEIISEVRIRRPGPNSGGAYLAFKRSAQVYATASAAVQLTMENGVCRNGVICLGGVGLTPILVDEATDLLVGKPLEEADLKRVAEAARSAADPQSDMRGSADYKRNLVGVLVMRALDRARRRAAGETVAGGHIYG